jgi:hypothetical protein
VSNDRGGTSLKGEPVDRTRQRRLMPPPPSLWRRISESTFFWGALGIAIGLTATVIPDGYRWLALLLAWLFFVMAGVAAAARLQRSRLRRPTIIGTAIGSAVVLLATYVLTKPGVDAVLVSEPGRLILYNRSAKELQLWGDKFDGDAATMEATARQIPRDGYYYLLTDRLQAYAETVIGRDGDRLEPFELYISSANGDHYTVRCTLLLKMQSGNFSVHAQNLGIDKRGW